MQINLTRDIASLRASALHKVDSEAEAARGVFITLGSGQAMVYDQKRAEAEAYVALYDPDQLLPDPNNYPHLAAEATMMGVSLYDQAVVYLSMCQLWLSASSVIEVRRLAAKEAVRMATTSAAIEAFSTVSYDDLFTMLPQ